MNPRGRASGAPTSVSVIRAAAESASVILVIAGRGSRTSAGHATQNATLSEPVARSTVRRSAPNSNAGVASETVAV
jgi:hypothetical protein